MLAQELFWGSPEVGSDVAITAMEWHQNQTWDLIIEGKRYFS